MSIDTRAIKKSIDLREYVEPFTTLQRESVDQMSGPCPKCGGRDRFNVTKHSWWCRKCFPMESGKTWDAIALVRWLDGLNFPQACQKLNDYLGGAPIENNVKPVGASVADSFVSEEAKRKRDKFLLNAPKIAERAANLLQSKGIGKVGYEYLISRGLNEESWRQFGLGYYSVDTDEPHITIPWFDSGGNLTALNRRYLTADKYGNKSKFYPGSLTGGCLFGSLSAWGLDQRTLLIIEGELNAISVWQVAHDTWLDVVSIGSESQSLSDEFTQQAQEYRSILVWADKGEVARRLADQVPGSFAMKSPKGKDANDLLQLGLLGGFLTAKRLEAAKSELGRARVVHDIHAGACVRSLDTSTAQVVCKVVNQMNLDYPIVEVGSGQWAAA